MVLNNLSESVRLDEIDLNILHLLAEDAKRSFAELGEQVGLTAPAVHGRVRKLEKAGVIKHYGLEIDYAKIGLPVTAFVRIRTRLSCSEVGKKLGAFAEIEECHSVAGEDDLVLKTRTATPLELQYLLDKLRLEGIAEQSISIFVLKTYFERSRI
jgi:Lrp/AsnC family leucine-responsive transcriptional regulator